MMNTKGALEQGVNKQRLRFLFSCTESFLYSFPLRDTDPDTRASVYNSFVDYGDNDWSSWFLQYANNGSFYWLLGKKLLISLAPYALCP